MKPLEGPRAVYLAGAALLMGCSPSGPVTVTLDGELFATLEADGWHHVSGELALPVVGGDVVMGSQRSQPFTFPVDEVVICEGGSCRMGGGYSFEVRGSEIWYSGVLRGSIQNASRRERRQVVALLGDYRPPKPQTVVLHAEIAGRAADIRVSAMPTGELVQDLDCHWPAPCQELENVIGSWTAEGVTVKGVVFPTMGALSQEHGGWRFDSSYTVRDIVMESDGDVLGPVGSVWRGEVFRGWLTDPLKPEDVSSPATGAAFFAMALMFEEWWQSAPVPPPPPPPPPRRDP